VIHLAESFEPLLAGRNICKSFAGVAALTDVNLELAGGEVLAVVGENGAGKSTLMKILAGVLRQDSGNVYLDGKPVRVLSPRDAQQHGIALIHQELNLCDNLDVAANIMLGREPAPFGLLSRRAVRQPVEELLRRVGLTIPANTIVSQLPIGQQQLVEIAKALSIDARVLIMDEPTSSLTGTETKKLFQVIGELRQRGVSIIYISHRLREIEHIADRVVVLRDGRNAGELLRPEIRHERIVPLMVGRDVSQLYARTRHPMGEPVLRVRQLATKRWPAERNSFEIRAAEIVGISGLVGSGRTEMLHALFGIEPPLAGTVTVGGVDVRIGRPRDALAAGLALVPEDRKQHGLILPWSLSRNVTLPELGKRFSRRGFLRPEAERLQSNLEIERLKIRATGAGQVVGSLSGGNQQKVVIVKWLATGPRVLLLDEPTRGIDVGAKQEIYRLMETLAREGMAILFVSSELEEVLGMSDRVLVMHDGLITGQLPRDALSEEAIMRLATRHERV
jgi:ribose transport system ATP-binding protein